MNKLHLTILLSFLCASLLAQKPKLPQKIKLEVAQDYTDQEALVLECINWQLETPAFISPKFRKRINHYVFTWVSGSPTVDVLIAEGLFPEDNPDFLMLFLSGWVKYSLENDYSKDHFKGASAGVDAMINFYDKNRKKLDKIKFIESLKKKKKKGKLKEYIRSTLPKEGQH